MNKELVTKDRTNKLTIEDIQTALPSRKNAVTQELVDMLNDVNEITIKKCILTNNNIYKLKIIPIIFIGCNIGEFSIDLIIIFFLFVLSDLIYIPIVSYFF